MTRLLLLLLLLVPPAAGARMYQWQDPISSSIQFAGVPPDWYRSPEGGPRVRVYDGGKLVDDTYIPLSGEDNRSMRDAAFRVLLEDEQVEAIKRLERAALREESRREQKRREAARETVTTEQSDTSEAPPERLPESLNPEMVGRLKDIIAEYDKNNTAVAGQGAEESVPATPSVKPTAATY